MKSRFRNVCDNPIVLVKSSASPFWAPDIIATLGALLVSWKVAKFSHNMWVSSGPRYSEKAKEAEELKNEKVGAGGTRLSSHPCPKHLSTWLVK